MYDISIKNVKKGKNVYYVFLLVGLLFLTILGAILVSGYTKLNSLNATTTSTRVEIKSYINDEGNTMYSPVYYYEVGGKEYICSSNSSSSINPGTSNKTVYYDSNNPSKCMTEYSKSSNNLILIFMLIPCIFIVIAIINIRKISKRIKAINELNRNGKLIKNLPYYLENTGIVINGVQIQRPVVDYTLPSGSTIKLYGDARHDRKTADADGMIDLVIDENNPDNYFIDFEINRLSGNLPQDYYNQNMNGQFPQYQQPSMSNQNMNGQFPQYQQPIMGSPNMNSQLPQYQQPDVGNQNNQISSYYDSNNKNL